MTGKLNIAEVVATFPPYHGGMGYVCYHNARELARRGHSVTVFTLEHGRLSYDADPREFAIVRLRTPLLMGDGGIVPQLCCLLRKFDVVHLHYPFYGGAEYTAFASFLSKVPLLLTYHMDVFGNTLLKRLLIGMYETLFMKATIHRADRIGALTREHLNSSKIAGFMDRSRIVEIPNGVDEERFRPREKDRALVERHGLQGKTVILFVGNLQPFKGLHLLIEALAGIRDGTLMLLVVGGGYREDEYRRQVRELNMTDRVIFAGPQSPDENLPAYYNLGDVLVLPSTHSEAFPLVVLEAFSSGIPVIVSSLPGPSGIVDDGRDGLIAQAGSVNDLRDKILYLVSHREERRAWGDAGRGKVLSRYSWSRVGGVLEQHLLDLCARPADPLR
ncbi:MAG: glycosyltransferase family 4 protein [Nitrospirota bacterium]